MDSASSPKAGGRSLWNNASISLLEGVLLACLLASLAFGPFSSRSERLAAWVVTAAVFAILYAGLDSWQLAAIRAGVGGGHRTTRSTLLVAVSFALCLILIQVSPSVVGHIWALTSSAQPFQLTASAMLFLIIVLLKTLWTSATDTTRRVRSLARLGLPAALLMLGVFQSTAYILVINNATLRFWAIADGIFLGQGYPLTLTEPGPVSAGSPPYVYDLPLFPLLMRASFSLLGHTSTAAHMPALISSILFPLSLYLLLQEMTGSRTTAVIFSGLTSSFPLLRFWVLNLPDPDPFFLTSLCLAAYLYLRVAGTRRGWRSWLVAGVASGVVSLARPEGILYVAFLGLGLLLTRPGLRRVAVYSAAVGAFVVPMVVVWWTNYGFLWPQNYNRTLSPSFLRATLAQLDTPGGLALYPKALGIGPEWALGLLALVVIAALAGTAIAAVQKPRLAPIALPALANSLTIYFTNPWISNAFNYADFFRHAAFGIPFVVAIAGYGCHVAARWLSAKPRGSLVRALLGLLLVAAVLREGDILANPTATHRPGSPFASQALADTTYLSLEAVLENPMRLPEMQFYRDQSGALIAYVPDIKWPDAALQFFDSMDMSYDTQGRAFGYGGAVAFLLALAFAAISEGGWKRPVRAGREAATGSPSYE